MLRPSDYARPQIEDRSRMAALGRRKPVMVNQADRFEEPGTCGNSMVVDFGKEAFYSA